MNSIWKAVIDQYTRCEVLLEETGRHLISTKTIKERAAADINVGDTTEEADYLIDAGLAQVVQSVLFSHGYRSIGGGYFCNLEKCNNPLYLKKMYHSADATIEGKKAILARINELRAEMTDGQYKFYNIMCDVQEPMTKEEFDRMIRRDAV